MDEYKVSPFTEAVWDKGLGDAPGLGLYVHETGKEGAQFGKEVFGLLANPSTTQHTGNGPDWAKVAHEKVAALPEFARAGSLLSKLPMSVAINQFAGSTLDSLRRYVQSVQDHEQEEPPPDKAPTTAEEALDALLNAVAAAEKPADFKPQSAEEAAIGSVQEVAESLDQAAAEAGSVISALFGAGCDLSEARKGTDGEAGVVDEIMQRLTQSPELLEIMELAGRWRTIARALSKAEPRDGVGRVIGVEYGDDLSRMLPEEAAFFVDPDLEVLFLNAFAQGSLALDKLRTQEAKVAGPLCVMLDLSGSMNNHKRHIWAKAVCLAIIEVALKQKRPVMLLPFNGGLIGRFMWDGEFDAAGALTFASIRPDGGTNFERPWAAFEQMVRQKTWADAEQADVVMITGRQGGHIRADCDP